MSLCRPNRATANRTRITAQEETCWGQLATGQNALGIDFRNESLANNTNYFQSELLRGDRMRSAGQRGNDKPGGDIVGELQPNGIWPLIIKHALGGSVVTTGSGPYKHTLQSDLLLPEGLSIEKRFGYPDGTFNRLRYLGSKIAQFGFEVPTEGMIVARASFIAKSETEETVDMDSTPSYPTNNDPYTSFHGKLYLDREGDGVREQIASVQSMSLLLDNGIDAEQFAMGEEGRADVPEDERTVNGNIQAFFTSDNWKLYQATKNNTTVSLDMRLTRGAYIFRFIVPAMKIRFPTPTVTQKGPLSLSGPFEAFRDDATQTDLQVEMTNSDPVISTAV